MKRRNRDDRQPTTSRRRSGPGTSPSGGQFANINRPIAGATHDQDLPVGKHPLQLYSLATPNGQKVAIMLEELLAARPQATPNMTPGRSASARATSSRSGFVAINPNSKIPALVDRSGPEPVRVFESGAILLHLAEKFGEFLPASGPARAETLSWLFWQMGSAPFLGGGFGHFFAYAPEKFEYPINRYAMEAKRQLDVLNRRLADSDYIAGADYSIADIAIWPWYGGIALGRTYEGADVFLATHEYEHVHALGEADRRAPGGQARADRQPADRRPGRATPRAPRRQRLRAAHPGQAAGGPTKTAKR